MTYGTILYGVVVLFYATPQRWGIVALLLVLDCKDNRHSTRFVWPLGLGIRTLCVAPWVGEMDL